MKKIKDNIKIEKNIILVGNKNDIPNNERKVFQNDIDDLIKNKFKDINDLTFMETSARDNYNIYELFINISIKVLDNRKINGRSRAKTINLNDKKYNNNNDNNNNNNKKKKFYFIFLFKFYFYYFVLLKFDLFNFILYFCSTFLNGFIIILFDLSIIF